MIASHYQSKQLFEMPTTMPAERSAEHLHHTHLASLLHTELLRYFSSINIKCNTNTHRLVVSTGSFSCYTGYAVTGYIAMELHWCCMRWRWLCGMTQWLGARQDHNQIKRQFLSLGCHFFFFFCFRICSIKNIKMGKRKKTNCFQSYCPTLIICNLRKKGCKERAAHQTNILSISKDTFHTLVHYHLQCLKIKWFLLWRAYLHFMLFNLVFCSHL